MTRGGEGVAGVAQRVDGVVAGALVSVLTTLERESERKRRIEMNLLDLLSVEVERASSNSSLLTGRAAARRVRHSHSLARADAKNHDAKEKMKTDVKGLQHDDRRQRDREEGTTSRHTRQTHSNENNFT